MKSHKNIKLLSWFNFFFYFRLYYPIAIIYFAQVTGSYALGLSIFPIARISQAFAEVPTGVVSDKLGRANALRIGTILGIISVIFYGLGQIYAFLAIGAIIEGIAYALFSGNNDALVYESLADDGNKDKYKEELGKVYSLMEGAFFVSALIGGFIAFRNLSLSIWLSLIPQSIALLFALSIVEPKTIKTVESTFIHLKECLIQYKNNVKLRDLSIARVIRYGIGEASWPLWPAFYNTILPIWAVGIFISLNPLESFISFRIAGKILKKIKAIKFLIYEHIYVRILDIVAFAYPTIASPFILVAASFFYGSREVAKEDLLQREFTDKQRATMSSINSLFGSALFAVVAVVLGILADRIGVAKTLLIGQILLIPVVFFYIKVAKEEKA